MNANNRAERSRNANAPHFIASKENDFYKQLKSYQSAKYRKRDKVLIAEGEKTYVEAKANLNLLATVASEDYYAKHAVKLEEENKAVESDQPKLTVFADNLFKSISELKTSQGILGIFEQPSFEVELSALRRIVVLEGIQDPKNVGAIIRNAHCLGYEAVFLTGDCAAPFSPKVIRASMGSVFHLPFVLSSSSEQFIQQIIDLKDAGFTLVGADVSGSEDVPLADKFALIVGNEGSGLTLQAQKMCDYLFRIRISEGADSLNAAVASGIAMYVLARDE